MAVGDGRRGAAPGGPVVIGEPPILDSLPRGLPEVPLPQTDTELDGVDLGPLRVRAASIRGDAHRYTGTTRQDALRLSRVAADGNRAAAVVACVADGVGSEPLSHLGATTAVAAVCEAVARKAAAFLAPSPPAEVLSRACGQVIVDVDARLRERAAMLARHLDVEPWHLCTTLTAAVLDEDERSPRRCVVFGIGDSPVLRLRRGRWERMWPVTEDPYAVALNMTEALPLRPDQLPWPEIEGTVLDLEPGDVLVLCSDGLGNPLRRAAIQQLLADQWGRGVVPDLTDFHRQLGFRARGFDDDRTAICIWEAP